MNQPKKTQIYELPMHKIALNKQLCEGFVLDIGGGGEGIIGQIYGNKTISVDRSEKELLEVKNSALKIVCDASKLPFLNNTFSLGYLFFSLMYMEPDTKIKVLQEAYRTLKKGAQLFIYDISMVPINQLYIVTHLEINLPEGTVIKTGYGANVKRCWQTVSTVEEMVKSVGFKIVNKIFDENIFVLELTKD